MLLLLAGLTLLAGACDRRPPAPVRDPSVIRGTALPPPAITAGPSRN
jgi:hypothetical protein